MERFKTMRSYIKRKFHPTKYISSELTTLLTVHAIFLLGIGLSNTFINIFLLKVRGDMDIVIWVNAIHFMASPFVFMLGGKLAKKVSLTFNLRLGIIFYSILFIVLLAVQDNAAQYVWLIGILLAMGGGFYYVGFYVLGYDFSNDGNRDLVMSIQGAVISTAAMIAPFVASLVIESFQGVRGYILIFSTSLTLFVIATVLSTKIPVTTMDKQYHLKSILLMLFKKRNWRYVLLGEALRGFREGVMAFLINVLLFSAISSELAIGYYTLVSSTVQLLSFYFIGKRIKPHNRKKFILIGAFIVMLTSSIFLYKLNVITIYIYGIFSAFFITFINNPTAALFYWVIHKTPNSQNTRVEGMVVKEVYLNAGRAIGIFIFLLIPKSINTIPISIFVLGMSQMFVWYLFNKVEII